MENLIISGSLFYCVGLILDELLYYRKKNFNINKILFIKVCKKKNEELQIYVVDIGKFCG